MDDEDFKPLPPRCMQNDEPDAAEDARRRVQTPPVKKRLGLNVRRRKDKRHRESQDDERPAVILNDGSKVDLVGLESTSQGEDDGSRDIYKWAVMYENQRGMTIFSVPYYSSLSLLPNDPPPFTVPDPDCGGRQPKVSLDEYPLPDGTWRWVSKAWMIDMRGDGAVQYDGFEYNWFFRKHHWRAEVGKFNAGGWVRRRRWLRLMVKPAVRKPYGSPRPDGLSAASAKSSSSAFGSSQPPSVLDMIADGSGRVAAIGEVWRGDADGDWERCQGLMKRFGRDGRRLELWRTWLSAYTASPAMTVASPKKQWTEDSKFMPSEADHATRTEAVATAARTMDVDKHAIADVLRQHGREILETFIYPDTRAQFLTLLTKSGLLAELTPKSAPADSISGLADFWSYNTSWSDSDISNPKGKGTSQKI